MGGRLCLLHLLFFAQAEYGGTNGKDQTDTGYTQQRNYRAAPVSAVYAGTDQKGG